MAWGAAATGTPSGHRLDRSGAVVDAGVARRDLLRADPAGRVQHGACAGRLLAGDARCRPRRLRACRCSHRWTCPKRSSSRSWRSTSRNAGATRCCSSATTTSRTRRRRWRWRPATSARSTVMTGRSTAPPVVPVMPGCCRRWARPSATSDGGYDLAEHYRQCAAATDEMLARHRAAGRDGIDRRRRRGRGRVRHSGEVRPGRRRPAACRGRARRVRPPDHPAAVPVRGGRRGRRRVPASSRCTRTTRVRWSTTCASPCSARSRSSSSAASASTGRGSASPRTSTAPTCADRIQEARSMRGSAHDR